MRLLYVTQKIHDQDTFIVHWINEFANQGYEVHLIVLDWQPNKVRLDNFTESMLKCTVHRLGKEEGISKLRQVLRFYSYIFTVPHDRVFLHLNAIWGLFGAIKWIITRTPVYTWYTHYVMSPSIWLLGKYGTRFFCATPQSLPQFTGNPKKIVTGHGIDTNFWHQRPNVTSNPCALLMVHRLSRSKRVELTLQALTHLPPEFTLDIYGISAEPEYVTELKELVTKLGINDRVTFKGTTPLNTLPAIYTHHKFLLNMASETIDKTMVEVMTCGCYPVTTPGNAAAIGVPYAPEETPEAIAEFIQEWYDKELPSGDELYWIVEKKHSLHRLIGLLDSYIEEGV